jgi:hypothetical protein
MNDNFWSLAANFFQELLDIDGRMARTLKTLITQPGELTRAFNDGQRLKYSPPLRLYLSISILFFLVFSLLISTYAPELAETDNLSDYYAKTMFILFPIFSLLVQLFYRRSRFIGNLVFSLHLHSMVYLALILITLFEANEARHDLFLWLQIPPTLYLGWYFVKSFKHVFAEAWLPTILKSGAIFFIYMGALGFAFDVVLTSFLR